MPTCFRVRSASLLSCPGCAGFRTYSRHINGVGEPFRIAANEEEWLQLDAKAGIPPFYKTLCFIGGNQLRSASGQLLPVGENLQGNRHRRTGISLSERQTGFFESMVRAKQFSQRVQEFVDTMVVAVQNATNQSVDRSTQVTERLSKEGSYLAVSIRRVPVQSGHQVLGVYREMKSLGGSRLKYII